MATGCQNTTDGNATLRWFADMGLVAKLTPDGERFTLVGLAALDAAMHAAVSQRAREQRCGIVKALREKAAATARIEANPPELWPLVCHYTSPCSIGHVLAAHGLVLEQLGDDFRLKNSNGLPLTLLPKLYFFFRYNAELINEWLRG